MHRVVHLFLYLLRFPFVIAIPLSDWIFFFQLNDGTPSTKSIPKLRNTFSLLRYEGERYDSPRSCDVLTKKKRIAEIVRISKQELTYSYFEKGCPKKCALDNDLERQYGIWSIRCSWPCRSRIFYCCFPLTLANISLWPHVPFFQVSLKNSELKTTHNTFRDCREHFFRQPFSK